MMLYIASNTRPDISFVIQQCARFTHNPKVSHEKAVKRICRYLQGTKENSLVFNPSKKLVVDCYADADFAGLWGHEYTQDPIYARSRTGFVVTTVYEDNNKSIVVATSLRMTASSKHIAVKYHWFS